MADRRQLLPAGLAFGARGCPTITRLRLEAGDCVLYGQRRHRGTGDDAWVREGWLNSMGREPQELAESDHRRPGEATDDRTALVVRIAQEGA